MPVVSNHPLLVCAGGHRAMTDCVATVHGSMSNAAYLLPAASGLSRTSRSLAERILKENGLCTRTVPG